MSMQLPGQRGLTADGHMGLPLLSFAAWPQPRELWQKFSPFSKAGSANALSMAKSGASSSAMSLLSAADLSSSKSDAVLTCIASSRWRPRERCGRSWRRIKLLRKKSHLRSLKALRVGGSKRASLFCRMGI
eukprot:6194819-Pleurochrysis_carterae.AAC.3